MKIFAIIFTLLLVSCGTIPNENSTDQERYNYCFKQCNNSDPTSHLAGGKCDMMCKDNLEGV